MSNRGFDIPFILSSLAMLGMCACRLDSRGWERQSDFQQRFCVTEGAGKRHQVKGLNLNGPVRLWRGCSMAQPEDGAPVDGLGHQPMAYGPKHELSGHSLYEAPKISTHDDCLPWPLLPQVKSLPSASTAAEYLAQKKSGKKPP